jgi:O-acetyl-ADP-ribose deacetylase (regulator of RNase III)
MLHYTEGNLLDAEVEAVVNTVNTVGVMGKGIALMFKERFPDNFRLYKRACDNEEIEVGKVFTTYPGGVLWPRVIINFPTKRHWREKTKIEYIQDGLEDLVRVIREEKISSIAIPPLGCGNGGLDWQDVKKEIETYLKSLEDVEVIVYQPTEKYQNVAKKNGVEKLTPSRAIIVEAVRRYGILGFDCTLLEIQKLAWFIEKFGYGSEVAEKLNLHFSANKFGPYAHDLTHLLDSLDGSYLHCDKRIADATPFDIIWVDDERAEKAQLYLKSRENQNFRAALDKVGDLIDGFESPLGMELLASVDWLISKEQVAPNIDDIKEALGQWPGGLKAGQRKLQMFDDDMIRTATERIQST